MKVEYNKAFKADSQRVAFLVQVSLVFKVQWFKLGASVAHYLTRRYASEYPTFSRHFIKLELGSI
ncbi:hypothetical protein BIW15_22345 [Vibrio sp. SALL6]|nr:hypothetical protein BIW15_22345 [Vibrio sp. SALL6]